MALIFFYLIGVLASAKPLHLLFTYNLDLFEEVKTEEQAKEAAAVCAWFWIIVLPAVTLKIVFHKIDMLIRRAV